MDILLGIMLVVLGLVVTFMGIQVFFATLPLIGFILGFFVGAAGVEAVFGDGFLSTVTGWIIGFIAGLIFAAIAWYWWYAGALLSAGALGAALATGLATAIGVDSGFALFAFGLIGFIAFISVAYVLNLPIYVVIVNTALAGSTVLITGILLIFNRVNYTELGNGTASAIIDESWWWVLVWAVIGGIGLAFQLMMKAAITMPEEKWVNANAAAA